MSPKRVSEQRYRQPAHPRARSKPPPCPAAGDQSREQLQATVGRMLATSIEPETAAERILAAVEADRLYALTHGDFEGTVRRRAEGILAALGDRGADLNHPSPDR